MDLAFVPLIAAGLWLLVGYPWFESRRKAKVENARRRRDAEWELAMLAAEARSEEEARAKFALKMAADLRVVLMSSMLRADRQYDAGEFFDAAINLKIPEDVQDVQVRTPKDDFIMYFWPRLRAKRVKR